MIVMNHRQPAATHPSALTSPPKTIENGKRTMVKLVNFEGKMVAFNAVPQGSIFVRGVWYSSVDKMPDEIREYYKEQLKS